MGLFKSLRQAYRALSKPGADFVDKAGFNHSTYMLNANADPNSDQMGNLWVGNAYDPLVKARDQDGGGGVNERFVYWPRNQDWKCYPAIGGGTAMVWVGLNPSDAAKGRDIGIYQIVCTADPKVDGAPSLWRDAPIYLQIFALADVNVPPVDQQIPDWSAPVPRPPELLDWNPGVRIPFNGGETNIDASACIAFSSTRDTYTATDPTYGEFGLINVSFAYYGNQVYQRLNGQ